MSELPHGLLIAGRVGVLVIRAGLYIETKWIGPPRDLRPRAVP